MWAETGVRRPWHEPFLITVAAAQSGGHLLQEAFHSPLCLKLLVAALVPDLCVSLINTLPEGRPGDLRVSLLYGKGLMCVPWVQGRSMQAGTPASSRQPLGKKSNFTGLGFI